jgi:hypothetical protein
MSRALRREVLEKGQEWEAFLALTRVMDASALETSAYKRLHAACSRLAGKGSVNREELILESGLSFFEECAEPDLALMCLVRQNILKPLEQQPFHFSINRQLEAEPVFTGQTQPRQTSVPSRDSTEEPLMQQANYVEAQPPSAAVLPMPADRDSKPTPLPELPPEIAEQLKKPLPPEAITANATKPGLSSVKVIYIIERLNEVFGLNGWEDDYEIVESGPMVVVRGCLRIPRFGITRQQYGGNNNPDRGDAYKGACTDALSKCASQLGIAIDVYKGLYPAGSDSAPKSRESNPSSDAQNSGDIDLRQESADERAHRFRQMERVLGSSAYLAVFSRHGYSGEPEAIELDKARSIYRDLLVHLRGSFQSVRQQVTDQQYRRILGALHLSPKAKLNVEQLIRLFEALSKEVHG